MGLTTKFKPQFDGIYCEKQGKRTFFRIKKKFLEIKNNEF